MTWGAEVQDGNDKGRSRKVFLGIVVKTCFK